MASTFASLNPTDDGASAGRVRLLMIDDDRKLCRLIADYLGPLGFDVTAVHAGSEGVTRATEEGAAWQAILLDVMLPEIDGFEVLRQIRRSSEVPILMLTARAPPPPGGGGAAPPAPRARAGGGRRRAARRARGRPPAREPRCAYGRAWGPAPRAHGGRV